MDEEPLAATPVDAETGTSYIPYEDALIFDGNKGGKRLTMVMEKAPQAIEELRQVVEDLGYRCVLAENSDRAINKLHFHHFDLIFLSEGFEEVELGKGPMLRHINSLPMSLRRRMFLTLIGDGFRSMDRMTAFAMSANLVVNRKDMDKLTAILRQEILDNQNFYRVFVETLSEVGKA
jgi:CheY-like chemotaxis protein